MARGRSGGTRGSERKSATFYGRADEGRERNAAVAKKKEGTRNRGEGRTGSEGERKSNRIAVRSFQLAWHDDEGGLVARLLVRSMSSLSSSLSPFPPLFLSRSYPSLPCPPVPSTVSSRSLSLASSRIPLSFVAPPTRQRSRAASRTRDTGACEIPLSSCERTPVRGQDYPAPCAIAKNQFVAPRDTLAVVVVVVVIIIIVIVGSDGESRSEIRHRGSQR